MIERLCLIWNFVQTCANQNLIKAQFALHIYGVENLSLSGESKKENGERKDLWFSYSLTE